MQLKKKQIGVIAAVAVIVVAAAVALFARFSGIAYVSTEVPGTFSVGGVRYAVISDKGAEPAVQVGSGTQPEASGLGDGLASSSPNVVIPATVTYEGTAYAVTEIAPYAFQGLDIASVELPEGLVKIGKGSFQFCRMLASVDVPASVQVINGLAFFADSTLSRVTFAEGSKLAEIGDGAFAIAKTSGSMDNPDDRAALTEISLPASLNLLGSYAFYGQTELAGVTFEGETLNEVSPYAFGRCTSLTEIELPTFTSTIERIGRFAFEGDTALATVVFNGGVAGTQTTQAGNEFSGCTNITTVIYRDKKWNASNAGANQPPAYMQNGGTSNSNNNNNNGNAQNLTGVNTNLTSSFTFGTSGFSDAVDLHEYYTVAQYASREDAEAGENRIGEALVLAGTPLYELNNGTYEPFESDGFETGAWAFLDDVSVAGGLADSVAAYPCDEHDLTYAGMSVEGELGDGGLAVVGVAKGHATVPVRVWNAAGEELTQDVNFTLSCADEQGEACDFAALSEAGTYTLVAEGVNSYAGSVSASFELEDVSAVWTRLTCDDAAHAAQLATRAGFANASVAEVPCEWAVVCAAGAGHEPEVLSATALAGALGEGACVLLNSAEGLSTEVSYEINRVGAKNVVVVGDASAVSDTAYAALQALYTVDKVYRIDGASDAELAANIVQLAGQLGVEWSDTCVLAGANDVAGAWSAASFAYATGAPILWCDGDNLGDAATSAVIAGGFSRVIVVGDADRVPTQAERTLTSSGYEVVRINGADAAAINTAFAEFALGEGLGANGVVVASSDALSTALPAGVLAGRAGAIAVFADNAAAVLAAHASEISYGYVLGSESVVSAEAMAGVEAL